MNIAAANLPTNLSLFFARRIALNLLEEEADVPVPTEADIQVGPIEGFEGVMELRWSLPISNELVLPILFEWHERIEPDREWLAEQAEEIASFAICLWHNRGDYEETFRLLKPKVRAAFRRFEKANLPVTLLATSIVPTRVNEQEECGVRVDYERLDESLQPMRTHMDVFCLEDLNEDETAIRAEQTHRGVLARAVAARGGGVLVDDVTLRALNGLGIDRLSAFDALDDVALPIKVADLVGANGDKIVLHYNEGVVNCAADVPSVGSWYRDKLRVDGMSLQPATNRHRGTSVGRFVKHPWIDPEQVIRTGYSNDETAYLTLEPKIWLVDRKTGEAVAW